MPLQIRDGVFPDTKLWFSATEAAAYLGINRDSLYKHQRSRRIAPRKGRAGAPRYHRDDLNKFYETQKPMSTRYNRFKNQP